MMSFAPRHLSQLLRAPQKGIKLVAFSLRTRILPIGAVRMGEGPLQLLLQRLVLIQTLEQPLRVLAPVDATVLLPGAADALDATEIQPLCLQHAQHAVQRLQPHGDGRKDLVFRLIGQHALLDVEPPRVGVEVELGDVDDLQLRGNDQALELLRREVEPDVQRALGRHFRVGVARLPNSAVERSGEWKRGRGRREEETRRKGNLEQYIIMRRRRGINRNRDPLAKILLFQCQMA